MTSFESTRSTRNQPFCWQEKKILRLLRKHFQKNELSKLRNLYCAITEMDSDFNSQPINYYTKSIVAYSGLHKDWVPKGLRMLQQLNIIEIKEIREEGRFHSKTVIFTPDKVKDIAKDHDKEGNFTVTHFSGNGKTGNGKTVTLEDSNILEILSKERIRDKSLTPQTEKKTSYKPNKKILVLLKDYLPITGMKMRLPTGESKITKAYKQTQVFLLAAYNGNLQKLFSFAEGWVNRNKIILPKKYKTFESFEDDVALAFERLARLRKHGFWPADKSMLPKSIPQFFYNPFTKTSWFLWCLANAPKELQQQQGERIKNFLPERARKVSAKLYNTKWSEVVFWQRINQIYNWYMKNRRGLIAVNIGDTFTACANTYDHFFDRYCEFLEETFDVVNLGNVGMGNKTWTLFEEYMEREFEADIAPRERDVAEALEREELYEEAEIL